MISGMSVIRMFTAIVAPKVIRAIVLFYHIVHTNYTYIIHALLC
jgi:hypothetical protein